MSDLLLTPDYLEWLHQLTSLGYDENIMISTKHSYAIEESFKEGKTPEAALEEYKEFLKRNNLLKNSEQ